MNINFNNIRDTYGDDVILSIRDNIDDVNENIDYLKELKFTDVEDIFERYALLFLYTPSEFKERFDELIKRLGNNYVDIIENDLSNLEELL